VATGRRRPVATGRWRRHMLLRRWRPIAARRRRRWRSLLLVVPRMGRRGMSLRSPLWRGSEGRGVPRRRPLLLMGLVDIVGSGGGGGRVRVVGVGCLGRGEGAGEEVEEGAGPGAGEGEGAERTQVDGGGGSHGDWRGARAPLLRLGGFAEFHVLRGTQVPIGSQRAFDYWAVTISGRPFQVVRLACWLLTPRGSGRSPDGSYNPNVTEGCRPLGHIGLGSSAFAHHY
jgi:hypothetical protein